MFNSSDPFNKDNIADMDDFIGILKELSQDSNVILFLPEDLRNEVAQ